VAFVVTALSGFERCCKGLPPPVLLENKLLQESLSCGGGGGGRRMRSLHKNYGGNGSYSFVVQIGDKDPLNGSQIEMN
jgi:hypothetical protein